MQPCLNKEFQVMHALLTNRTRMSLGPTVTLKMTPFVCEGTNSIRK